MRMLDNVIDINYYAVKKARDSNLRHRPVGLGIMGFQDALYEIGVPYASEAAVEFADRSMEAVCYHAYWASTELAAERGRYSSYRGSLWDRGILPMDSLDLLAEQRGGYVEARPQRDARLGCACAAASSEHGMRNSNCVAIAPTATISNIVGVSASIEPSFGNLSVKSNLSGEFTIVNEYLVRDLKKLGLWDDVMVMDLKHFDGSLRRIDRVPARSEGALRDRVRGRDEVAGRGRGAAPEVDRPGAVAQHLHGRRIGQEARRDLQARVAARPEDDLLPAHRRRDARREVDGEIGAAERGGERRDRAARVDEGGRCGWHRGVGSERRGRRATSSSARSTIPDCEACQ